MNKSNHNILRIPLDAIGMMASILCAIHCAALPLLLSLSTLASLHFLAIPWIEYSVIIFSLFLALVSFLPAFKRHHAKYSPLVLLGLGFILIGIGQLGFYEIHEIAFTVGGASVIAIAHALNWVLVIKSKKSISKNLNY
jgi:hypothetical protein